MLRSVILKIFIKHLNLWTGEIHSKFTVENIPVDVITYCHQQQDAIAVKIISPLIKRKADYRLVCVFLIQPVIGQIWEIILAMMINTNHFIISKNENAALIATSAGYNHLLYFCCYGMVMRSSKKR